MADYWKSQPRKFCQYCKCWIADNKPSIDFHERGKNHKENVASKISEIKKKSVAKAKQEKKMSKDFAKMEAAAQLAYAEDLRRLSGEILPAADAPATTPPQSKPQKPPKPPKAQKKSNSRSSGGQGGGRAANGFQSAWVEGVADDGNVYYYNTMTGESRWVQPDFFFAQRGIGSVSTGNAQSSAETSWIEAVSPEGYTYYYNAQTGESSWEKPTKAEAQDKPADDEKEDGKKQVGEEPSPQEESRSAANADNPSDSTEPAENTKTSISSRKRKEDEGDHVKKKTTADPEKPSETAALVINITPATKTRKTNPYGAWERVQPKEDPYEKVDLQLPEPDLPAPVLPVTPVEPKARFKERVITSLGVENSAGATFRKKKTDGNKFRSLRKRDTDE